MVLQRLDAPLADDATFRFGNLPACKGKPDIRRAVDAFFGSIAGCRHDIAASWQTPGAAICHGTVTYTRRDGSHVTVPFANVLAMRENVVSDYLIFADITPLYARGSPG